MTEGGADLGTRGTGPVLASRPDAPGALFAEAALCHALDSLEAAGVEAAVIKGIPLARRLYGTVDGRGVPGDADLLVRRADATAAIDALLSAGYTSPYLPAPEKWLRGVWKVVLRRRMEAGLVATVELHWAPFSPRTFPLAEDIVWRHIEGGRLPARAVRVPDRALTLVLLACHLCQSGLVAGRLLDDFAACWNAWSGDVDPATLGALVSEARAVAAFSYALGVARRRRLLSVPAAEIASIPASVMGCFLPTGRESRGVASGPDYRGQAAALLLTAPSRLPVEILRHLVPSRMAMAVATERPVPGVDGYLSAMWARLRRIFADILG